ncbi:MAG: tetratricopeptide repeat protein [Thermoflavifilum sp.]|nr:tetratricopeptide repeat protein [Thermoflavifilum sp.]MCL6513490.1 tetratricopeptide repeat protein [Alicyclobacillus sp.]
MKWLGLYLIWRLLAALLGNPWLALLVILVVLYVLDQRYVGLTPSFLRPIRRMRRHAAVRQAIALNPHDANARHELAQMELARHHPREALEQLRRLPGSLRETPEIRYEEGVCLIELGRTAEGEALIRAALAEKPRLAYGDPYLKLAALHVGDDPQQALHDLEAARTYNQSSCEALYRLAALYRRLGRMEDAQAALRECVATYRALPRFRKRKERRWAWLAMIRGGFGG